MRNKNLCLHIYYMDNMVRFLHIEAKNYINKKARKELYEVNNL